MKIGEAMNDGLSNPEDFDNENDEVLGIRKGFTLELPNTNLKVRIEIYSKEEQNDSSLDINNNSLKQYPNLWSEYRLHVAEKTLEEFNDFVHGGLVDSLLNVSTPDEIDSSDLE